MKKGSNPRVFTRLLLCEAEGCLNLPVLSLIVASAIIAVLVQSSASRTLSNSYINLYDGASTIFLILTFVASTLFANSFAGSLGRGEVKRMLSYPVKRWQVFLSKVVAIMVIVFGIYGSAFTLNLYLSALSVFEPLFYVSLFVMFLQLLLVCSITIAVSMITKSEIMSILTSFLLILGLDYTLGTDSYLSSQGRFSFIFGYFEQTMHDTNMVISTPVTVEQLSYSIAIPIMVALVALVATFVYFTQKMEVD